MKLTLLRPRVLFHLARFVCLFQVEFSVIPMKRVSKSDGKYKAKKFLELNFSDLLRLISKFNIEIDSLYFTFLSAYS